MKADIVKTDFASPRTTEIIHVDYKLGRLIITATVLGSDEIVTVSFSKVAGFRVLDEGDLLEFWPTCSAPNGWLYHIVEGGWFEQESQRTGFLSRDTQKSIFEYLVIGVDVCVNVLAWEPPTVRSAALTQP